MNKTKYIFAGIGLGFLVGLIVGLTTEGLSTTLLTTLVAVIAGYFGVRKQVGENDKNHQREIMVGFFAFSCGLSLLLGIQLRVHDALGLTPTERINYWKELGFNELEAKRAISIQILGVDLTGGSSNPLPERTNRGSVTGLFSDNKKLCEQFKEDLSLNVKLELLKRNALLNETLLLLEENQDELKVNTAIDSLMRFICLNEG